MKLRWELDGGIWDLMDEDLNVDCLVGWVVPGSAKEGGFWIRLVDGRSSVFVPDNDVEKAKAFALMLI